MVQQVIRAPCHAKINLYLKVLGRRADGFHELATVFQMIDLCDELLWKPDGGPIRLENAGDADFGESNLIRRAIKLYIDATGVSPRGSIKLTKRIPIGGGLGGGSSNAASMLTLLNDAFQKLSKIELKQLGLALGSDVPYFLEQGCQWGFGRGEVFEPCTWAFPEKSGFLFVPPFGMGTAEVFRVLNAGQLPQEETLFVRPAEDALGENDLESAAFKVAPTLEKIMLEIQSCLPSEKVFMSGSGSTLVWLTSKRILPSQLSVFLQERMVKIFPFTFC